MKFTLLKIIAIFIIGMVGGIFAEQIFWPYFVERPLFYKYKLEKPPVYVTEKKEVTIEENTALKNAIEKVEKTVVGIKAKTRYGKILEGTGTIISSDGLIITLAELLPSGSTVSVFLEGKLIPSQILKRDLNNNLALLKIKKTNLQTAGFADLEKIKLGERVFLLGIVFEKDKIPRKIVNEGIIKYIGTNFMQTNILEKDNILGSPLFDIKNNILGLNIIDKEERVNVIPISKIREFTGF